MSVFQGVSGLGNTADVVSSSIKKFLGDRIPGAKGQRERTQEQGQTARGRGRLVQGALSLRSGTGKRVLTEFVVIAFVLAIPSKIIWSIRDANLAYIANTHAQRAAVKEQVAQGKALVAKEGSYKALEAQDALKVPKAVGYSGIVNTLTTLAGRTGVQLVTVSAPSKKPAPIKGSVYQWTVNATITGSFPAIQSYIDSLQSEPRLYQVQQVQIGVASFGASGGVGGGAAAAHVQTFSGGIDNAVLAINVESLA